MDIIAQEARKRQSVVKLAMRKGKSFAAQKYGVSLSSVKRWCKKYDGKDWRSLKEGSHRPKSHPKRHTEAEEMIISKAFWSKYERYGWEGVYMEAKANGYTRSLRGMIYAAKRLGLTEASRRKPPRRHDRRYPELNVPGEKVQIDVKEVPFCCLRGDLLKYNKHLYQWTAIDECTRMRFVYAFEEHTQENTVKFLEMLGKAFPFKIQTVQTDNGVEFTYKYISETEESPFDKALKAKGIAHKLIPPRTPWHNGKVERSHRNDQRYFYDWESFSSLEDLNQKLAKHLEWSNKKPMRTLGNKSPKELLAEKQAA
jgi:transposase InsO family protein